VSAPRVTVLMCVHNGGAHLRPAIESVLAQTWRDFEFLIIDDGSTDTSVDVVRSFADPRIRLLRNEQNLGLTCSLNVGLREARGEFIVRQDADDLSVPQRLERQVGFLASVPKVPLLGSQARLIDGVGHSRGNRDLPLDPISLRWESLFDNPLIHSAVIFRRAVVLEEFGGYDESFPCCQDYDLWTGIMERYPVVNLPDRLVSIREHSQSVSVRRKVEASEMVRRVVTRSLAQTLPNAALRESEIDVLCRYRTNLKANELSVFRALFLKLDGEFRRVVPEAAGHRDLARTQARELARVAYNLITEDRLLAASEFVGAIRRSPGIVSQQPWLRIAALFVLGAGARGLMERLRRSA
jgi:glycosyltransferase involved in cell wall biosynthesis